MLLGCATRGGGDKTTARGKDGRRGSSHRERGERAKGREAATTVAGQRGTRAPVKRCCVKRATGWAGGTGGRGRGELGPHDPGGVQGRHLELLRRVGASHRPDSHDGDRPLRGTSSGQKLLCDEVDRVGRGASKDTIVSCFGGSVQRRTAERPSRRRAVTTWEFPCESSA